MRVKINKKYYQLSDEELQFVRSQIGEWETNDYEFDRPLLISVPEIARAKDITRQAVTGYAKRHDLKITKIGNVSFLSLEDTLEHWFRAIR